MIHNAPGPLCIARMADHGSISYIPMIRGSIVLLVLFHVLVLKNMENTSNENNKGANRRNLSENSSENRQKKKWWYKIDREKWKENNVLEILLHDIE